ncbi:sentrin-specific protease 8-like [Schistocerca cancellata]|uniref:sentrin-specific protease 8-like n=1 Tax=Schistocerca cancellata TaxID=274614 RepID=UPI0021193846|nr:sentrin-specific protease 8-like [Schistocerca cancellata]XP_049773715.1 sentrin-specific protease 8-like [Schistocerca cancellata]
MARDQVVLSFHDTLLHRSDIELLTGPYWLNDTLISFYFEYLQRVLFMNQKDYLFIGPEVTQCLKVSPFEEINVFLDPLNAKEYKYIFLALNDSDIVETTGGTHWSLLVYCKLEDTFFHFDSSSGFNNHHAKVLADGLSKYFSPIAKSVFIEAPSLQQTNSYDCGVHLLCNVDHIIGVSKQCKSLKDIGLVNRMIVNTKRMEILDLIETLSEKRE